MSVFLQSLCSPEGIWAVEFPSSTAALNAADLAQFSLSVRSAELCLPARWAELCRRLGSAQKKWECLDFSTNTGKTNDWERLRLDAKNSSSAYRFFDGEKLRP